MASTPVKAHGASEDAASCVCCTPPSNKTSMSPSISSKGTPKYDKKRNLGRFLGSMAFGPWQSIDEFTSHRQISKGRGCSIISAYAPNMKQQVAIKAYVAAEIQDHTAVHIRREASLIRNIRHDAVCQIYGAFEDASSVYIVMELCSQGDLMERLNGRNGVRKFSEAKAAQGVLYPLISALQTLHSYGIVHRDIKPENMFIDAKGSVKLGDFGLAINQLAEPPMSQLGTLDYMAPEVFRKPAMEASYSSSSGNYNEKIDIWACGVLAYEVVTGEPPFHAERHGQQTKDLIKGAKVPLGGKWPVPVSPELADFIQTTLQKDPAQRPSAAQLLTHPWLLLNIPSLASRVLQHKVSPSIPCGRSTQFTGESGRAKMVGFDTKPTAADKRGHAAAAASSCPTTMPAPAASPKKPVPAPKRLPSISEEEIGRSDSLPVPSSRVDPLTREFEKMGIRAGAPAGRPDPSTRPLQTEGSLERMLKESGLKARTKSPKSAIRDPEILPLSPDSPYSPSPTTTPRGILEKWTVYPMPSLKDATKKSLFTDDSSARGQPTRIPTPAPRSPAGQRSMYR